MTITPADVGRRVRSKEGDLGTIASVLEAHGIVYVKFDYQLEQDRPYPTTDLLLEFDEDRQHETDSEFIVPARIVATERMDATMHVGPGVFAEPITEAPQSVSDGLMEELAAVEAPTPLQPVKRGRGRPRKVRP